MRDVPKISLCILPQYVLPSGKTGGMRFLTHYVSRIDTSRVSNESPDGRFFNKFFLCKLRFKLTLELPVGLTVLKRQDGIVRVYDTTFTT